MDIGIALGVALAAIGTAVLVASLIRVARRRSRRPRRSRPLPRSGDVRPQVTMTGLRSATVVLDIPGSDPSAPAVQRLVQEAAAKAFAIMPDLDEVEVRGFMGEVLGRRTRMPRTPPQPVAVPQQLLEPHVASRHEANPVTPGAEEDPPLTEPVRGPSFAPTSSYSTPRRLFSERFELAGSVLALIADPDDPVDAVRSILEAGGLRVESDEDFLRVGDIGLVVLRMRHGTVPPAALDHAFIRIQQSGVARGVVVSPGLLDQRDVRRREMAAPHVVHVGPEAIQRMADAVAVGGDPLRFAQGPALASGPPVARPAGPG